MCHAVWTQIEKQILRDACAEMEKKHEEYLNQPSLEFGRWFSYKFTYKALYPYDGRVITE